MGGTRSLLTRGQFKGAVERADWWETCSARSRLTPMAKEQQALSIQVWRPHPRGQFCQSRSKALGPDQSASDSSYTPPLLGGPLWALLKGGGRERERKRERESIQHNDSFLALHFGGLGGWETQISLMHLPANRQFHSQHQRRDNYAWWMKCLPFKSDCALYGGGNIKETGSSGGVCRRNCRWEMLAAVTGRWVWHLGPAGACCRCGGCGGVSCVTGSEDSWFCSGCKLCPPASISPPHGIVQLGSDSITDTFVRQS